jgi:hypothetical protein
MTETEKIIRESVAALGRLGVRIKAFECHPETAARLIGESITVLSVVRGDTEWMKNAPNDGLGRGVGSRYKVTLCGIPLEQRV